MELPEIVHEGQVIRFCQQCGRFHLLAEFDGDRRSCRRKLQRHNERRRRAEEAREAELALQRSSNPKFSRSMSHIINTNISHLDPTHPAIVDLLRQVGVHTHPPPPNQHLAYRPQMFPPTEYHPAPPPPRSQQQQQQRGLPDGKSPWRPFSEAAQQQMAPPPEQEEHHHPTIDPALMALLEPMLASAAATAVQEQIQQQQQYQGSIPHYQEYQQQQQQQQQFQGREAAPTEMELGYVNNNNDNNNNAAMIENMLLEQLKLCLSQTEDKSVDGGNGATTSPAGDVADPGTHINIAGLQSLAATTEDGGDANMQSAADHLLALFNALNSNKMTEGAVAGNDDSGMNDNAATSSATTTNTTATTTATTSQQQPQLQGEGLSPSPGTATDNTTTQPGAPPVTATATTTGTTTTTTTTATAVPELPEVPADNMQKTTILAAAVAALQTSASPLNNAVEGGARDGVALHPPLHPTNTPATASVDTDALLRDIQAVAVSIKLFKVVPADLPPTLLQDLQQFIDANPESLEAAMRPGCVHIGATVLLTSEEARRLADNLGALANRLAERADLRDTALIQINSTNVSRTALFGDNRVTMVLNQQGEGGGQGLVLDREEMRQTPREGQVPPFVRPLAAVPLYNGPVLLMGHGLGSNDARVYCRHHSKYHSLVEVVRRGAVLISNNVQVEDDVVEGVDTPDRDTENNNSNNNTSSGGGGGNNIVGLPTNLLGSSSDNTTTAIDDAPILEYSDDVHAGNNKEDELGYVHLHLPRLSEVGSYTFEAQQKGVTLLHPGPLPTMLVVDDPDVVKEVREMEVPGFDGGRWSHQDVAGFIALMGFVLNKYEEMVEHNHKVDKMMLGGSGGGNSGTVVDDAGNASASLPFAMKKQLDVRVRKAAQNVVAKCLKYGWGSTIELYLPACMGGQDAGESSDGDHFKQAVRGIRAALRGVPLLHAAIASGSVDTVIALWKWQRQLQKLVGGGGDSGSVGECYHQSSWSMQLLKASKKKNTNDGGGKKGRKSSAALCPLYVVASLQNPVEMAKLLHRLSPELTPMWTQCESDDGCWPCPLAFAAALGKSDLVEIVQSLLNGGSGSGPAYRKVGEDMDNGNLPILESSREKKLRIIEEAGAVEKADHHQQQQQQRFHGASTQYRFFPVVLLLVVLTLQMALLDKFEKFNLVAIPFGLVLALLPVISFSYRCS